MERAFHLHSKPEILKISPAVPIRETEPIGKDYTYLVCASLREKISKGNMKMLNDIGWRELYLPYKFRLIYKIVRQARTIAVPE